MDCDRAFAKDDPIVWQRNGTSPTAWFSERERLRRFLQAMFTGVAGLGVWAAPDTISSECCTTAAWAPAARRPAR